MARLSAQRDSASGATAPRGHKRLGGRHDGQRGHQPEFGLARSDPYQLAELAGGDHRREAYHQHRVDRQRGLRSGRTHAGLRDAGVGETHYGHPLLAADS
jgi:hypothetical protein